jgi:hypothetical protein
MAEVFEKDADLVALRSHVTEDFMVTFNTGVNSYLHGDWAAAREALEKSDRMMREAAPSLGGDGPSVTLLRFMCSHKWIPPAGWKGYRELQMK